MRKFIAGVVLALALAGSFSIGVAPASAHNFDTTSWSTCNAERTKWTASSSVKHSHPVLLTAAYVDYACCVEITSLSHRRFFGTRWWNGATSSHDWSGVMGGSCP